MEEGGERQREDTGRERKGVVEVSGERGAGKLKRGQITAGRESCR